MAITLVTAPADEPISVAEAKLHSRVDGSDNDSLITGLIIAARIKAEDVTGRQLFTATWKLTLDIFPPTIRIDKVPVSAVSSVKYVDTAGVQQTLDASKYQVDLVSNPARLVPAFGESWPSTRAQLNTVEVEFIAGFGLAAAVPQDIKQAMLLMIGHWYDHRESVVLGTTATEMPMGAMALLLPWRIMGS